MRVLIACESSGVTRRAFAARGHEAWSCDLLPSEDESPYHIIGDALDVIRMVDANEDEDVCYWDMMIAHPPCTYLCNSGVRWLKEGEGTVFPGWIDEHFNTDRFYMMQKARTFFMKLWEAPIPKIVIENPVPHKYAKLPKYNQTIQPYMFGDDASKRTCLWLKGVPPLVIPDSSKWTQPRIADGKRRWANQAPCGADRTAPSVTRGLERSRTYDGIGQAFVDNWG